MTDKKKVEKSIESFQRQIEKHKAKINSYRKDKEYLIEYWEKQIKIFEREIEKKKQKLGKF